MEFNLKSADFVTHADEVEVISQWIDSDFQKEQEDLGNAVQRPSAPVLRRCSAKVENKDGVVEVVYDPDLVDANVGFFEEMNKSLSFIFSNVDALWGCVADELLEIWNKEWRRVWQSKLNKSEFIRRLGRPDSIEFHGNGKQTILIDAKKLFSGHMIEMRMSQLEVLEIAVAG
jgi:hypothetical protein